jgi:Nuclease-related domain
MKVDPEVRAPRTAAPRARFARLLGMHVVEGEWAEASGRQVAGVWLGRLPEGWFVFHDVPAGERGATIEQVVIGPGGVFTITTKNLTGSIRVNPRSIVHDGHRTSFLPKASADARRAGSLLSAAVGRDVEVRGLLAILADEWIVRQLPPDVYVGGPRSVKHWMLKQPPILRSSDVIVLAATATRPETWITHPHHDGRAAAPVMPSREIVRIHTAPAAT